MGYNKIIFVRNDMLDEINDAPLSVVERICAYGGDFYYPLDENALSAGSQAMTVFPEVHASSTAVYVLSGNTCKEVLSPEMKTINGKKYFLVPVEYGDERTAS